MSTTFQVIPTENNSPKFNDVLRLAEQTTHDFLKKFRIMGRVRFQSEILSSCKRSQSDDKEFRWSEDECAWISAANFSGGTDVYCESISDSDDADDKWWFFDELRGAPNFGVEHETLVQRATQIDQKWRFRRSAGQSAIIHLCYGHLAAAAAELSSGLVFSNDGAWAYELFPCSANQFLGSYFIPELAGTKDEARWVSNCIAEIRKCF